MTVAEQSEAPDWGRRYGWLFAAVWLFYLGEPVSALTKQPSATWRVVGLVAVAAFAISYMLMVRLASMVRHSAVRARPFVLRPFSHHILLHRVLYKIDRFLYIIRMNPEE